MVITVNGKQEEIKEKILLIEFLKSKALNPNMIVMELNCIIIKKEHLATITLNENDTLEIIRFVGGG